MKMTCRFIAMAMLLATCSYSPGQFVRPFPEGIGLEIGGGHSDATWKLLQPPPDGSGNEVSRGKLSFMPTVRLSYALHPLENAQVLPFVEYNRFGGRLTELSNGYKDEMWFDALGFGVLTTYSFSALTVGTGIKLNDHLRVTEKSLGAVNIPSVEGESWDERDFSRFYRRTSWDVGFRAAWTLNHWSFGAEGWFGLTQLESKDLDPFVDVHQRHFRALVGYRL